MIIQNGSRQNQDANALARAGDDAPRAVAVAPSTEPRGGVAVELPQVSVPQVVQQKPSAEQLKQAVENINRAMRLSGRDLEFSLDTEASRVVVKMTDSETGEVIRQIPSEETLAISRSIGEFQQGLLLRQQA
jgi:flagellar protein FlaG